MTTYLSSYKPSDSALYPGVNDIGSIKYSVREIEKEREFEKKKALIVQQFRKIDRNSDEHLTLEEWIHFLQNQVLICHD